MSRIRAPFARLWDWWAGIPDEGQVSLVGLVLLGAGAQFAALGLLAPGIVVTAISLGFNARDRAVAIVVAAAVGLAVIAAIVVGGLS